MAVVATHPVTQRDDENTITMITVIDHERNENIEDISEDLESTVGCWPTLNSGNSDKKNFSCASKLLLKEDIEAMVSRRTVGKSKASAIERLTYVPAEPLEKFSSSRHSCKQAQWGSLARTSQFLFIHECI